MDVHKKIVQRQHEGRCHKPLQSAAIPPSCTFRRPPSGSPPAPSISDRDFDRAEGPFFDFEMRGTFLRPLTPVPHVVVSLSHALSAGVTRLDRHSRNAPVGAS